MIILKYVAILAVGLAMATDTWSKNERRVKCMMGGKDQETCESQSGCYWSGSVCVTDCSVVPGKGPCQAEEKTCNFDTRDRSCSNKIRRPVAKPAAEAAEPAAPEDAPDRGA
jgi:hypothetical protein